MMPCWSHNSQTLEVSDRSRHKTAFALNRLQNHRSNLLGGDRVEQRLAKPIQFTLDERSFL